MTEGPNLNDPTLNQAVIMVDGERLRRQDRLKLTVTPTGTTATLNNLALTPGTQVHADGVLIHIESKGRRVRSD